MDGAASTPGAEPIASLLPANIAAGTGPRDPFPAANGATALISLGGLTLGIPVANLREVMVRPPGLQPLPAGGRHAVGCVALRGQVIPVLDLATALTLPLPGSPPGQSPGIIAILRADDRVVGIAAHDVHRIVQSRDLTVQDLDPAGSAPARTVLPGVALFGEEVVSLLDARALIDMVDVPHATERPAPSRHLDRSSQYLRCEIGTWRYCVSVRQIEATLADTVVDSRVLFHGACEGTVERHGIEMALMNPRIYTGFAAGAERLLQSGGVVVRLDAARSLTLRSDRISDILHLQRGQIAPMPKAPCARPDLFLGVVFDAQGEPCYVLDIEKLIAEPQVQSLAGVAHRRADKALVATDIADGPKGVAGTAIFVRAGGLRALPIQDVEEIAPRPAALDDAQPRHDGYLGWVRHRDALLPVFCMTWLAGVTEAHRGIRSGIVIVRSAGERIGLLVEDITGIEPVRFVEDAPEVPHGPKTRLAMRNRKTPDRLVAVWDLEPLTTNP
ncbi:hypothetical protein GC209_08310 [bacterium]|nr:hypothetical protein [bacterium]